MTNTDWRARAACRNSDPSLFDPLVPSEVHDHGPHPEAHNRIQAAISVCTSCPVQRDCDLWATATAATGVWAARYRRVGWGNGASPASQRGKSGKKAAA